MLHSCYPDFMITVSEVGLFNVQSPLSTSRSPTTCCITFTVIDAIWFLLVYKEYMPRAQLNTAQELCESESGRPGLLLPLIVRTVSVDIKQHWTWTLSWERALQDPVLLLWLLFDDGTLDVLTGRVRHANSRTTGGGGWLRLWLPPGHGSARHVDQGIF